MAAYDQTWVRQVTGGFVALGSRNLCASCGIPCGRFGKLAAGAPCAHYTPVLSFVHPMGLDRPCNTFRRGLGSMRKLKAGQTVRFYATREGRFVGAGRVQDCVVGPLFKLLPAHAPKHHLMHQVNTLDAASKLLQVLQASYGKNWASLDADFSVVYLESCEVST